jgi:hypothetical protein
LAHPTLLKHGYKKWGVTVIVAVVFPNRESNGDFSIIK